MSTHPESYWNKKYKEKFKKYKSWANTLARLVKNHISDKTSIELEDLEIEAQMALLSQLKRIYENETLRNQFMNPDGKDLRIGPLVFKKPGITTPSLIKEDTGLQKFMKIALWNFVQDMDYQQSGIKPGMRRDINKMIKARDAFAQKNDKRVTDEELREILGWTPKKFKNIKLASSHRVMNTY